MKTAVISYSFTGNNELLAKSIAGELAAEHIKITTKKPRTQGSIFFDLIFHQTPKVMPVPEKLADYDQVIFVAPIWVGEVATPLRAYLKYLNANPRKYAFVSLSGGSDGIEYNHKVTDELKKRAGKEPNAYLNLIIADLLPAEPKPTRKDTTAYQLNPGSGDLKILTESAMKVLKDKITK